MKTRDAVLLRRSVRAFLFRPVEGALLGDVLDTARRAPSGGNLQAWRVCARTAEPLDGLKKRLAEQIRLGGAEGAAEYPIYPQDLASPFRERRYRTGEQLYAALDLPRGAKRGRLGQFSRNFAV